MSFQNFRLQATPAQPPAQSSSAHENVAAGSLLHSIPLNVHQHQHPNHPNIPQTQQDSGQDVHRQSLSSSSPIKDSSNRPPNKAPYGSGDVEDGYTLVFNSMDAFEQWREKEEEEKIVEFVKGDTHGSKAVPPRFKDHTKLVCARHQRSGRKKYIKKYPERQRKVPSRKLEGLGCLASISYKTYFDTDEVRVMYNDQHSHEIGESNLPFTRRGRRMEVARQKFKPPEDDNDYSMPVTLNARQNGIGNDSHGPSASHAQMPPGQHQQPQPHPNLGIPQHGGIPTAIAMLAPLPNQMQPPPPPPPAVSGQPEVSQERWDRLEVLFQSVRSHARGGYDYPGPSVAALESVLIRLYLESPVSSGGPQGMGSSMGRSFGNA